MIGGLIVSAMFGAFVVMFRATASVHESTSESVDVQLLADSLAVDVNQMSEVITDACGADAPDALIGLRLTDGSSVTYLADAGGASVLRHQCAPDGSRVLERTLVRSLGGVPAVRCDGEPCRAGSSPDVVGLVMTERSGLTVGLLGAQRVDPSGWPWNGTFVVLDPKKEVVKAGDKALLRLARDAHIASTNTKWFKGKPGTFEVAGEVIIGGISDPLAAMPVPSAAGLPVYTDGKYQGPGVYLKTLEIKEQTELAPGIYILEKGMKVKGDGGVTGTDVLLYNGCPVDADPKCKGDKEIKFEGKGSIELTPYLSGPYAGVLIFQDRDNDKKLKIRQKGDVVLNGVVYAIDSKKVQLGRKDMSTAVAGVVVARVEVTKKSDVRVGV